MAPRNPSNANDTDPSAVVLQLLARAPLGDRWCRGTLVEDHQGTLVETEAIETVQAWATAWTEQDVDRYLSFYSESFLPADGSDRDDWAEGRRQRIGSPSSIEVELAAVEVDLLGPESAEVTFVQSYRSDRFSDRVRKALRLNRSDGRWRIALETVLETLESPR